MSPNNMLRCSPKFFPIAWILIGLMVGGSLFDYLATKQTAGVCVELRILEQEDDRSDLSDLQFVPICNTWCLSSPPLREEVVEIPTLDIWAVQLAAHRERGPPTLVMAFVAFRPAKVHALRPTA